MFWKEHGPPHFHAVYAEYEALIEIRTLEVLQGSLPRRALAMVLEWAADHRGELMEKGAMRTDGDAAEDRATGVMPVPRSASPWRVAEIQALPGYRLSVRFNDGTSGTVDMARFISLECAGVFSALKDATLFARASIVLGVVTWPGGLDLAPDTMYRQIQEHGTWIVR